MKKAAIDVGSNSVLLLVEEKQGETWVTLHEGTAVTSLGAGTKSSGLLSEPGMDRTLEALCRFFAEAAEFEAESIDAAATMAARIAKNADEFLKRAADQGTPVKILSGDDEAQLGFEAVAYDSIFAESQRISIVDVGGQSTEIVTAQRQGKGWETLFRRSFPLGTLALKDLILKEECPGPEEVLAALVHIDDTIGLCYRRGMCGDVVALGATGTNLVTIRERIAEWDPARVHGQWLMFGDISEEGGRLMRMPESERAVLVGMEPGREATLPAGALILERALNAIGSPGCFVSTRGWRHALLENGWPEHTGQ